MSLQILIRNRATDLDARMHDGTTPLILAARLAVDGMVEELINCHADANATDDSGSSRFISLHHFFIKILLAWVVMIINPLPFHCL